MKAENLKVLARELRISQAMLGTVIGCSQQSVSKKLNGKIELSLKDVAKICDYFNTVQDDQKFSIEQLFGDYIAQLCEEEEE